MENRVLIKLRGTRSRAEVAKDLKITPQGLGMIERGDRVPRPDLMKRIADYYGKTVDELFFNADGHDACQNDDQTTTDPKPAA